MASAREKEFRSTFPDIHWLSPKDDGFAERRVTFYANDAVTPKAIICPQTSKEVQAFVRYARSNDLPFTVRSGGHDLQGRSVMHDVLCIDMRNLNSVQISPDRKSAKIGGGILTNKLQEDLSKEGLVAAFGNVGDVGYFGWASLGGYGVVSTNFGLGVDNLLTAEVVDSSGNLVQATPRMMKAIRGAGGTAGVVTSIEIKTYALKELLSGILIVDTASIGLAETFKQTLLRLQELQANGSLLPPMNVSPMVLNHPENGRVFILAICWSSDDHNAGRKNLDAICDVLPTKVLMNTVTNMTIVAHINSISALFDKSYWGGSEAVSFKELSPKTLNTIGRYLEIMPKDPGTAFVVHIIRADCPSVTDRSLAEESCFSTEARQKHFLLELIGFATTKVAGPESVKWAGELCGALTSGGETMDGTYISLSGKTGTTMDKIYGKNWEIVKRLKNELDPEGIFKHAVPVIPA